jgi:hypothetical protein
MGPGRVGRDRERAIADGLLVRCGVDELHGEVIYALTEAGRNWLEGAS